MTLHQYYIYDVIRRLRLPICFEQATRLSSLMSTKSSPAILTRMAFNFPFAWIDSTISSLILLIQAKWAACGSQNITSLPTYEPLNGVIMTLEKRLAANLKKRRGELSQRAFAKQIGVGRSTLTRLENCDQNATLRTLGHLTKKFKCDIGDLFD